jgi:hypothetical protein
MNVDFKDPKLILAVIKSIVTYGLPAILVIAELLKNKNEPSAEDIEKLFITKSAEEYFED